MLYRKDTMDVSPFKRAVQLARTKTPAVIEELMGIVNGTAIVMETRVLKDGDTIEVAVAPKHAERIAAGKVIMSVVMNKESMSVADVKSEIDEMSPFEKKRLAEEFLEEANREIMNTQ